MEIYNLSTNKVNKNIKNEGLGFSVESTQLASETIPMELYPAPEEETTNLVTGRGNCASLQLTDSVVGEQGVLTKTQFTKKKSNNLAVGRGSSASPQPTNSAVGGQEVLAKPQSTKETSNLTVGRGVGASPQPTPVRRLTVLTKSQKRNKRRQNKRRLVRAAEATRGTNSALVRRAKQLRLGIRFSSPALTTVPNRVRTPFPAPASVRNRVPSPYPVLAAVSNRARTPVPTAVPSRVPTPFPVSAAVPNRVPISYPVLTAVPNRVPTPFPVSAAVSNRVPICYPVPTAVPNRAPIPYPVPAVAPSRVPIPSPTQVAVSNRAWTVQPQSCAQAMNMLKMSIVRDGFPLEKLSQDDIKHIQMEILRRTDMIPSWEFMPKIQRSVPHAGTLLVHCDDAETADWLKATFHGNDEVIGGTVLKILNGNELPKPIKIAFKTKDVYTKNAGLLLRRLNRLNPELKSEEWRFIHKVEEPYTIRWIFEVNWEAAEAIKRADYGAFTGLDRGTFKILNDPNIKTKEAQVEPSTSSQEQFVSRGPLLPPDFMIKNMEHF
ncbi:helicase SRCAP-like isoform X1 [Uloborus diversus]|uniref:helicase SRCAP-like isoform X1 n=1 Tax=Uloborus diversus TaxID=327109 RepID=UPI00240955BE|nr:helicase SRCAP-like isoform X1 [Uloborus diversus]